MFETQKRSVLVIDDNASLAKMLEELLSDQGYHAESVTSVEHAIALLEKPFNPMFILADRMLGQGPIEEYQLEQLSSVAQDSHIVIYTTVDDLTNQQMYRIYDRGAIRVIDKRGANHLVQDIKLLTREFDELIEISHELQVLTSERSKLVAALVGSEVGVTVIDRNFHCWFANDAQERIVGQPCSGNLCWKLFHRHPVASGPCWGCTVSQAFEANGSVERLFLLRFANETVKWVSVRSIPILDEETGAAIAVREAVTEAKNTIVEALNLEQRLQKIAEGLIYIGFGRVRIYKALAHGYIELCAALSRSDDPRSVESRYRQSLGSTTFRYDDCPYAIAALNNSFGIFVPKWDPVLGPSPFAEELDLELPYFAVPIFYDNNDLCAFLCTDFVGVEYDIRESILAGYAKEDTLKWLQRDYASEIKGAFEAAEHHPKQREFYEVVQRAEIGIGASRSVDDAIQELRDAFSSLVPQCKVFVHMLADGDLKEYENLQILPHSEESTIGIENAEVLATQAIKLKRALWIYDLDEYRSKNVKKEVPFECLSPMIRSCAYIPLMFENNVYGILSIESLQPINWEENGYIDPLLELSRLAALVVRDISMQEDLEQRSADLAALTAYSMTVSGDAIWRHWASQRLAEASAAVYRCRRLIKEDMERNELDDILVEIEGLIEAVSRGHPPDEAEETCSLEEIIPLIRKRYEKRSPYLIINSSGELPSLRVPSFYVRHILEILVDNAVRAMEESGIGEKVTVSIQEVKDHLTQIEVRDDGPGILRDIADKLLRGPVASKKGLGVGLLIARGTALRYGGDLIMQPVKIGACFKLSLPVI